MKIAVIGAYGYTGRLICDELEKNNIGFSIYGRDAIKLKEIQSKNKCINNAFALDLRKETEVQKLLNESDVLINCAGPFTEEAKIVLRLCAEQGKIYLDISGEVGFVKNSFESYDQIAKESGALLIHACAFESLVVDLMMHGFIENKEINTLRTFYQFNQKKVSPGTRMTMKMSKFREPFKIENGLWSSIDFNEDQLELPQFPTDIAFPYPLPEIAFAKWNFKPMSAGSFLILDKSEASLMELKSNITESPLEVLDRIRQFKPEGPTAKQREEQRSLVIVQCNYIDGTNIRCEAICKNMYQLTAVAMRLSLEEILNQPPKYSGVISPAKLFLNKEEETLKKLDVETKIFEEVQ